MPRTNNKPHVHESKARNEEPAMDQVRAEQVTVQPPSATSHLLIGEFEYRANDDGTFTVPPEVAPRGWPVVQGGTGHTLRERKVEREFCASNNDVAPSIRIDSSFADAFVEMCEDGKLDAYFARSHVFYNNETVAPPDMSTVRAAVHNAWGVAAMARGPQATMVEAILRLADRALSNQDDAALRPLYRKALGLLGKHPMLDACPTPEGDALGRLYPRRRFLKWIDFENAVLDKLEAEAGVGISPHGVAQVLSVWLLAAPVQRIVEAKKLRAAIEKKMSGKVWLDAKKNVLLDRAHLELMITAAMRAASVTAKMRWKIFKKDQ